MTHTEQRPQRGRIPTTETIDLVQRMGGDVLIGMPVVCEITSLTLPTIKKWCKEGRFPEPARLADTANPPVAWSLREVLAWVEGRKDARPTS